MTKRLGDGAMRDLFGLGPLRYRSADDCPERTKHTPTPSGYLAWHAWAEKKARTHSQSRCSTCGYYVIWKVRHASATSGGSRP